MAFYGTKDQPDADNLRVHIPITFINAGPRTGSVFKTAVTVYKSDKPHERHYMEWEAFWSFHQSVGLWGWDETAHEISIQGNSTVAKWISYNWEITPKLYLTEGRYILVLHYWENRNGEPKHSFHSFIVDKEIIKNLEMVRDGSSKQLIHILLDKEMETNRLMTEHESKKLLGI